MKKITSLIICTLLICTMNISCKKDSDSKTTTVEYRISPMNNFFTKIAYTDIAGQETIITDPTQFPTGSKSIKIVSKPFNARLSITINNTTNATISYNLTILVNGKVMATNSYSVAHNATTSASTEYTVQ